MTRIATTLIALTLSAPAFAGAKKVPEYDLTDDATTLKSAKKMGFETEAKPRAYPGKVAIGYFATRYHFKETQAGKDATTITTLKFTDEHYTRITDQLYAQLVARLEAEGFEVVDKDAVVNSAAYGALEEKDEVSENGRRVRFAPSGMKNLATFSGAPKDAKSLAAINAELGTDAVVAAFVNIGICTVDPTKKTEMRAGVYACIKGDLTMPGVNVVFLGGAKGEGDKVKPEWTSRFVKKYEAFDYDKKDNLSYDTAIISKWASGQMVKDGFWKRAQLGALEEGFVGGSSLIYDDALAMGFAVWEAKNGSAREAAGMTRRPYQAPAPLPEGPVGPAPEPAPAIEVPALEGEIQCFAGKSSIAGKEIGDILWRRGITDGRVVEERATLMPGQPPYRYLTTMDVDGSKYSAAEVKGTWTGGGTFEPGWASWTSELKMGNGMLISGTGAVGSDGLVLKSATRDAKGKVLAESEVVAKPLDQAACDARFAELPPIQ